MFCSRKVVGVIMGIVACIVDAIGYSFTGSLVACISRDGTYSGDPSYNGELTECNYVSSDCSCRSPDSLPCYYFNGPIAASSCDNILVEYNNTLKGAIATDVIATVAVLTLSITACASVPRCARGGATSNVVKSADQVAEAHSLPPPQMAGAIQIQQYHQVPPQV